MARPHLDLALACEQDVIQLHIPMQDPLAVAVVESVQDLLQEVLGDVFFESSASPHVREQIPARTEFLNVEQMLLRLEGLVKSEDSWPALPDNAGVAKLLPYRHLPQHLVLGGLVSHYSLVDRFDRNELPGELVDSQIHLPESAFAQHLPDLIEL